MLVVGLTGGIATGKSTAAKMFQELGALLIDADKIAHEMLEPNQPTWQKVVGYFGSSIVQADGQIKRKVLAKEIYNSDVKRLALNTIVHPPVVAEIERQIKELTKSRPDAIIIVDVPLLFEVEWPFEWDKIIVVAARQDIQFKRLLDKERSLRQDIFKKRLRCQLPLDEKAKRADWVIENNGSLEHAKEQVEVFYKWLEQARDRKQTNCFS